MSKLIIIQLGSGCLQSGFPLVTAQLWEQPNSLPEQFTGSLPAAHQLQMLSQSWQALYRALCDSNSGVSHSDNTRAMPLRTEKEDLDDDFEIESSGIQNVSSYDFEALCQTLSEQFNQWLCSAEFGSIERPLRSRLSLQDDIRIILTTQVDPIRRLPWQRWAILQDFPNAELALSLPQYRRQQRVARTTRKQPRILAILGNAQGIDLALEQQLLSQIPQAEVEFLLQPSRQQFHQALWHSAGWDLLFFAGHSSSHGSQTGRLYINEQPQQQNSLTINELSEALSAALEKGLQLVIFNSCDGLGLANQLAHLHIPQVIVMREPVPNRVAQQFFQSFLAAYVQQGLPLYSAIKRSRRQLQALEGDFPGASWLPILCQNPAETPLAWHALYDSKAKSLPQPSDRNGLRDSPKEQHRHRQIFLNKVNHAWIKGVLHKSVSHQVLINPGLAECPTALQTPAAIALESISPSGYPLPPTTQISDYFEQLGIGRSLLLLGNPGAGKTTALLSLTQSLIQQAEATTTAPMPVVLNLSTWQPNQSVSQWVQSALHRYYQVPQPQSKHWLSSGQLTLLLDGLDEVPSKFRSSCIQAINQFRQTYGQVEMVVCTRQKDYEATEQYLSLQAALTIQPLSSAQIQDYCSALGESGQFLQQLIARDRQLGELATSPLMLNIITLATEDDPSFISPSPDTSLKDRRHRLLSAYINRMLLRRSAHHHATTAATISGLRYLAQQLNQSGQSVFQLESIQPSWLNKRDQSFFYPLFLGLTLASVLSIVPTLVGFWLGGFWVALSIFLSWGIVSGTLCGLIGGWLGGITGGLIGGALSTALIWILVPRFSIGLLTTPILAIFMGFICGACRNRITPAESFRWSWQKAGKWLVIGIGAGLVVSLPMWQVGIVEWRVVISTVAVLFSLLGGFTKRSRLKADTIRPNEGIWQTGKNALQVGLLATLIYGLLSTVIFGLNTGGSLASFQASWPFGAIAGLLMGTLTGLVGAEGSGVVVIQHWVLRVILWHRKQIPWNYAQFLDGCANQILLKKVGNSYIFVHRLLQEHFADWRPSP